MGGVTTAPRNVSERLRRSSKPVFRLQKIEKAMILFLPHPMARHTIAEYQWHLEECTGGLRCDIIAYGEGEYERLGAWVGPVEIIQVPDVVDLRDLRRHVPEELSTSHPQFDVRFDLLEHLQTNQRSLEEVWKNLPIFRELLQAVLETGGKTDDPMAIVRRVRRGIGTIIWNATPLLLKQIGIALREA